MEKLRACRLTAIGGHTEAAQFVKGTTRQHSARGQEFISMYKEPQSTAIDACTLREREEKAIAMLRRRTESTYNGRVHHNVACSCARVVCRFRFCEQEANSDFRTVLVPWHPGIRRHSGLVRMDSRNPPSFNMD